MFFVLIIIFSRLTTKRINPLVFSSNADCQWVNCSQNETYKSFGEHLMTSNQLNSLPSNVNMIVENMAN